MKLQRLYSLTRQAMEAYQMIEAGDRIAIGISGGKDSLTLLYALSGLRKFYPKPFTLEAIIVNLGFSGMDFSSVVELCEKLSVPCHMVDTQISDIVFQKRKEKNPCSLCATLRKGALNDKALSLGMNKIAYAHHQDDAIETLLMSLIYEGRFSCFLPVTYLDKTGLVVIRPMIYLSEADVIGFQRAYALPVVENSCPMDKNSKRESVKRMIRDWNLETPGVKQRLFSALVSCRFDDLDGWKRFT